MTKSAVLGKVNTRKLILKLLRQTSLSRAELARQTGLTRAAISQITEELIRDGLVIETEKAYLSSRGRTPTLLQVVPSAMYCIGVQLSRNKIRYGIADFSGKLVVRNTLETYGKRSAEDILKEVTEGISALVLRENISWEKIYGIGVSAPGPLDAVNGKILNPPNFSQWKNVPVAKRLTELLLLPCFLENDANALALQYALNGDFLERDDFLLVLADSGFGSGLIHNGKLLRSSSGFSCELGHTSINFRGPVCSCGNRGCLEGYASIPSLMKNYQRYVDWQSLLASSQAEEAMTQEAEYLSAGIVNLCNIIPVKAVLLAGELALAGDPLISKLETQIQNRPMSLQDEKLVVYAAPEQDLDYVCSAANIALCHYLEIC